MQTRASLRRAREGSTQAEDAAPPDPTRDPGPEDEAVGFLSHARDLFVMLFLAAGLLSAGFTPAWVLRSAADTLEMVLRQAAGRKGW